ncbi:hypothetical protein ACLKMH_02870 [Psychromonas sp. KJ10-10]|uniref:hypothetical protein n=1 Tax=Psychromonas sp. KJ10-10 TaxID=3391823 RepID=UPI0039B69555
MLNTKNYKYSAIIASLLFALTACSEGPAEKAGEKIDDATTDLQNAIEDSCESVKDAVNATDKDC